MEPVPSSEMPSLHLLTLASGVKSIYFCLWLCLEDNKLSVDHRCVIMFKIGRLVVFFLRLRKKKSQCCSMTEDNYSSGIFFLFVNHEHEVEVVRTLLSRGGEH